MQLETNLRRLAARLPARQQTLEFFDDDVWQELPREDQQACHRAISSLLLQVLEDERHNESYNDTEEKDEYE